MMNRQQLYKWCQKGDKVKFLWETGRKGVIIETPDERGIAVAEWADGTQWYVDYPMVKVSKGRRNEKPSGKRKGQTDDNRERGSC